MTSGSEVCHRYSMFSPTVTGIHVYSRGSSRDILHIDKMYC